MKSHEKAILIIWEQSFMLGIILKESILQASSVVSRTLMIKVFVIVDKRGILARRFSCESSIYNGRQDHISESQYGIEILSGPHFD
jgi:hypothetical protein